MPLPKYVSQLGAGELSATPPGVFTGCRAMTFSARGDRSAMTAFARGFLQDPTGGEIRVTAASSRFFLYFFNAEKLLSPAEPIGWTPNREFSLAYPVIVTQSGRLPRLLMWAPYVIIDNARGMVTGRESWGWFKGQGDIRSPRDPVAEGPDCSVDTLIFPRFAPTTQGQEQTLIHVGSRQPFSIDPISVGLSGNGAYGKQLAQIMAEDADHPEEFRELSRQWIELGMPAVNLKQFRDASDPARACHQSITTCPLTVMKVRSLGFVRGDLEIAITPCDSHRIVQQLGLDGPTIKAGLSLTADLDYQAASGETLWSAPLT